MEEVIRWLDDPNKNSQGFFRDPDGPKDLPGQIGICVAGLFMFQLTLQLPFKVTMRSSPQRESLKRFLHLCSVKTPSCVTLTDALMAITASYLAVSDDLHAEMDDDDTDGGSENSDDSISRTQRQRAVLKVDQTFEKEVTQKLCDLPSSSLSDAAKERILRDYRQIFLQKHFGWRAAPATEGNLRLWTIQLFNFEGDLMKDMEIVKDRTGRETIDMEMEFPPNYPFEPPFLRVIRPRFQFRAGRVTIGGSICSELLVPEGWNPTFDIESIIETIRQQITEPKSGARIDHTNTRDYSKEEATMAFERVAQYHRQHGWS